MDRIIVEERKWIENGFLNIFPDKIVKVRTVHFPKDADYVELFSDDTDKCFVRLRCEDIQEATELAKEFEKQMKKSSLKVVQNG